jgi:hypothetical protein
VLFVASAPQVQGVFLGWRSPRAPRTKLQKNPFTGETKTVQTTEPDDTDAGTAAGAWDLRAAEVPQGQVYERYLESRIPPEIRRLTHRPLKRVLFEMMLVAEALEGKQDIPEALFPPSGCTTSFPLLRFPDGVTAALRNMNGDEADKLAARLAKDETFKDWGTADVTAFVTDLRVVAMSATPDDGVYVLAV